MFKESELIKEMSDKVNETVKEIGVKTAAINDTKEGAKGTDATHVDARALTGELDDTREKWTKSSKFH